jgi:hypothetical protein
MNGFLDRLIKWILKPIWFPGKWPVIEAPAKRYNRDVRTTRNARNSNP